MWWKIWYVDSEIIGTSVQEWIDAPDEGVVGIYEFFGFNEDNIPLGRVTSGSDWYWMDLSGNVFQNGDSTYEPNIWVEVDLPYNVYVKKGKWVSDEKMEQVANEIAELSQVGING